MFKNSNFIMILLIPFQMSNHDYIFKNLTLYGPKNKLTSLNHLSNINTFCSEWSSLSKSHVNQVQIFNKEPVKFGFDLKNQNPIIDIKTLQTVLFKVSEDKLYDDLEKEIKSALNSDLMTKIDKSKIHELTGFNFSKMKFILKIKTHETVSDSHHSDSTLDQCYDYERIKINKIGESFIHLESDDTKVRYVFDICDKKIDWELFMYFEEDFRESLLNLPNLGHKVKIKNVENCRKLRILSLLIKPLMQFLPGFLDSLIANGRSDIGLTITGGIRKMQFFINYLFELFTEIVNS